LNRVKLAYNRNTGLPESSGFLTVNQRSTLNNILEHGVHELDGQQIKLRFENPRLEQANVYWSNKVRSNYYKGKFDEVVPNPVAPVVKQSAAQSYRELYFKLTGDRFTPTSGVKQGKDSRYGAAAGEDSEEEKPGIFQRAKELLFSSTAEQSREAASTEAMAGEVEVEVASDVESEEMPDETNDESNLNEEQLGEVEEEELGEAEEEELGEMEEEELGEADEEELGEADEEELGEADEEQLGESDEEKLGEVDEEPAAQKAA